MVSSIRGIVKLPVFLAAVALFSLACKKSAGSPDADSSGPSLSTARSWLTDKLATEETAALFYKLRLSASSHILFGHQDDTKRGYGWANEEGQVYDATRSDVKEVTGVYPAVYGWDFNFIAGNGTGAWFDYENKRSHELAVDAYNRGGINTFAWHYYNPVSGGSFYWDQSPVEAVSKILPGGSAHTVFTNELKKIAAFAKALIGADGKLIPVIFRPFHEFDGDWFWWGAAHCTVAEYKQLYQFTVTYLRDSLGVHNFLYAWSPDKNFTTSDEYTARYPGDAYVDILGTDNYGDVYAGVNTAIASAKLKIVSDMAVRTNKVAALTETGLQNLTQTDWYTRTLLPILQKQKVELAYVLVWANTTSAFWTPYKGHASSQDFILFKNNAYLMFGDKVSGVYQLK